MKIAAAGFQHETNSFADTVAARVDFEAPGGWPRFSAGSDMMRVLPETGTPMAGALSVAARDKVNVLPLLWCLALPSGPVEDAAFEEIASDICARFEQALASGATGLYLDLHGAMATPSWPDAEGELLARLREIAPSPFPIAASFDLHANLSEAMVRDCTLLDCYRTYPHTDLKDTGERVMTRLIGLLQGERAPHLAYRQVPYLASINDQCTFTEPTRDILAHADRLIAKGGLDCVSQLFGFPLADIPDAGPSIVAQGADAAATEAAADEMLARWIAAEGAFATRLLPAKEAVAEAIRLAAGPGQGPVVIADTQDNPGGGGTGDTTGMARALIEGGANGAVFVHIADPDAAEAACAAGEGAVIEVAVGAGLSGHFGAPILGPWKVERLGSGSFTGIGPMYRGNAIALGPVALLEQGGVRIIVAPRKMQASEPGLLLHLGLDPEMVPILVVKSSVHFRGAYQQMARAIVPALAPGLVEADLTRLPYRNVKRRPAGSSSATSNQRKYTS